MSKLSGINSNRVGIFAPFAGLLLFPLALAACFKAESPHRPEEVRTSAAHVETVAPCCRGGSASRQEQPAEAVSTFEAKPLPLLSPNRQALKRTQARVSPRLHAELNYAADFMTATVLHIGEGPPVTPAANSVQTRSPNSPFRGLYMVSGPVLGRRVSREWVEELAQMDVAYQRALRKLFGDSLDAGLGAGLDAGGIFGDQNPFAKALEGLHQASQSPSPSISDQPQTIPQHTVSSSRPPVWADLGGGEARGPFSFLLFGDFAQSGRQEWRRAFRKRDGGFVLEDSREISLSSGFLVFREDEKVLTADLNRDGLTDLVSTVRANSGTTIRTFHSRGGVSFERMHSFSVPGVVKALAAFEFTGDGADDLVLLLEGFPRLVVYRGVGDGFSYDRELVLPFTPGLVIERPGEGILPRRLQVFDPNLTSVVTFNAGPEARYVMSSDSILELFETVQLNRYRGNADVVHQVFQSEGRVTWAEKTGSGVRYQGSFSYSGHNPLIVLGDYFRTGSPQILLFP